MQITSKQAVYDAVYDGLIESGAGGEKARKWANRASIRYMRNQFESPQQLIEQIIEDGSK